jgi:tRNA A-37 threonylcarbamoyl transferase component Bud32
MLSSGDAMRRLSNAEVKLTAQILDFCRHIAGQSKIVAVAHVDNYSTKLSSGRMIHEVMLVIQNFQPRLMSYLKPVENKTISVFAVDQWVFERDIDRGLLGEAIASKLVFPYTALQGEVYLHEREIALKKRLVLELLENLALNFPELVARIQILPQYFMYEVFYTRVRVFPLLVYDLADLTISLKNAEDNALGSYMEALSQLETEEKVTLQNGYVFITPKFIACCQNPKLRFINFSKTAPRTLFASFFGVLPQLVNRVGQNTEVFLRTQKISWIRPNEYTVNFIDSRKYVFFPTAEGLVSLADKIDIKGYAQRLLLKNRNVSIQVAPAGGILNDVYVINASGEGVNTKILVKRFKDWSGFKWFPLTLWSFGARTFAVSGQARLAKEIAASEFLRGEGFNVPKILHVSNAELIVFMEFIEGEGLNQVIKRYATTVDDQIVSEVLSLVSRVGENLARVHGCNVVLGDTKPDNVLIKSDGSIFLIDFEQALQGGDKAWDVAVFLYYCGHYLQPFDSVAKAKSIALSFIEGYLRGGGSVDDIHKAALSKYTRIFSIFTVPPIMLAMSNVCKMAERNPRTFKS